MRIDTLVRVETPEGITLSLRSAGLVARCYAFLIDLLIRVVLIWVAGMLLGQLKGFGFGLFLVLVFAVEWLYPVVFEQSRRAATPGKRALGLRVVMDDGLPVALSASLLRNLLRTVDFLPMLYAAGIVTMLWRSDFKRLGDVVAGTRVVHDRLVVLHGTPAAGPALAPRQPLTPAQQTAIADWALRAPRLTAARAEELAAIARPLLAADAGPATAQLLAVARWALGDGKAGA